MKQIVDDAECYLASATRGYHGHGNPAVVFDIDDTLLNTYDYTLASQFGYNPPPTRSGSTTPPFPAVFGMPQLVNFAAAARLHGLLHHRPARRPRPRPPSRT